MSALGVRVRKHKGLWYVFVNLGGRRKAHKIGPNRRVANQVARALRRKIALGEYRLEPPTPACPTFAELATEFLARYPLAHPIRPNTLDNHQGSARWHLVPFFGRYPVREITPRLPRCSTFSSRAAGRRRRCSCASLSEVAADRHGLPPAAGDCNPGATCGG